MDKKKIIKYSLSFMAAIFLLYFSFRRVDWKVFWMGLKSCSWAYVCISMVIGVISFYFRSLRWHSLLISVDSKTSVLTCFNAVNISFILNILVPRMGEFVRCGIVTTNSEQNPDGTRKAPFDKVLGTAVVDRVLDIFSLLVLMLIVVIFMWKRFGIFLIDKMLSPVSAKIHLSIFILAFITILIVALLSFIIYYFRNKNKICLKIYEIIKGIYKGIITSVKTKKSRISILYSLIVWFCYCCTSYAILLAFKGIDPSVFPSDMAGALGRLSNLGFSDAVFLMIVGAISSFVPVPGGFGAFHYLITMALQIVYGIPIELGIIFATLTHESQIIIQIICGGGSYADEVLKKKKRY